MKTQNRCFSISTLVLSSTLAFFLNVSLPSSAKAQSLYIPPYCENNNSELLIRNKSAQTTTYWLGWTQDLTADEIAIDLVGNSKSMQTLNEISTTSTFKVFPSNSSNLNFQVRCQNSESILPLTTHTSPIQYMNVSEPTMDLNLANLSWEENSVVLEWLNTAAEVVKVQTVTLPPKAKEILTLETPLKVKTLRINGTYRLLATTSATLPNSYGQKISRLPARETGAFFEMGLRHTPTSPRFIVYIDDPALLSQARDLLKNPTLEKIVFGRIARGNGGYNIDTQDSDRSPWSWHYEAVTSIADFGSTACNGTPEILEDHLNSWLSSNPYACFWSYRLLRELKPNAKF